MDRSDEQLIQAMAVSDEDALIELHRRYAPYLTSIAKKMLSDSDDVQQCVQDSFMKAWEAAKTFDAAKASAKTWLVTINHRMALNKLRGKQLETVPLDLWDSSEAPPNHVSRIVMETAVASLDADAKQLIELAFYRGHSHREIATLLNMPLGTVKSKLRTALNVLRDKLEGKGDGV